MRQLLGCFRHTQSHSGGAVPSGRQRHDAAPRWSGGWAGAGSDTIGRTQSDGRSAGAVLLATAVIATAMASVALASGLVGQIEVVGAQRLTAESVIGHSGLAAGKPFDATAADAALKALYATGLFEDVRIEHAGGHVVVRVSENPIVASVSFEGRSAVDEATLEAATRLQPRATYSEARAHADALAIRDAYRQKGRLATSVEVRATVGPEKRVDVAFLIREGPVVKIESIALNGNRAFGERHLKGVMRTAESSWLDILKDDATYRREALDLDRELIRRHYQKHGFPDAKVSLAQTRLNADGTGYAIVFDIEEGERVTISGARIESQVAGLETGALARDIAPAPGSPYDIETIDAAAERMTLSLVEKGYGLARVTARLERPRTGGVASVVYRIVEGPKLTIERIDIRGNSKTRDHVIRRELKLAEGDAFNAVLVARDKGRVLRLGFFKSVEIKPARGSAADKVVLTVEVAEQESGEIGYGIGYSWSEGAIADIGVTDNNFLGTGDTARLKVAGSLSRLEAEAGYTRPHFLGSDVAAGFDIFYRDQDLSLQSSYKSRRIGGGVRFTTPLNDEWTAGLGYSFSRNTVYDVGSEASAAIKEAVPGFPATNSSTYYTSAIGTTITYDTRDKRKLPASGAYIASTQDFAGAGGDTRFVRTGLDARYYHTLGGVTLIGRASAGAIGGWGGDDVRLLDLFYKGGETVRGFASGGIGPRDTASANRDALGGKYYAATTAEARMPLPFVPDDAGLKFAAFADAGSLFGATETAAALPGVKGSAPALRASAGAGLVWDSPIGPLRADYAIPLAKQAFDKMQPWSFGLAAY